MERIHRLREGYEGGVLEVLEGSRSVSAGVSCKDHVDILGLSVNIPYQEGPDDNVTTDGFHSRLVRGVTAGKDSTALWRYPPSQCHT